MKFADTNWLEALYFESPEKEQQKREALVQRFMRKHGGQLAISQIVYLEARNVFSRTAKETEPEEWRRFVADLGGLLYLDPLDWDSLRREAFKLFARYAPRATIGTLDMAILASAKLSGATQLLSFDQTLKAVALAEGLDVFPMLSTEGKTLLSRLKGRV
jgi:predicted nucleic acid-binding protein